MRQQKIMVQTKEEDKTPEELSYMKICNLPKEKLRVMTIKMIKEFGRKMDAQREKLEV